MLQYFSGLIVVIVVVLLLTSSGCLNKPSQPTESSWDDILTVQTGKQFYERNGEPFEIGIRYNDSKIETSEGHVLYREPISTNTSHLKDLAGTWFADRGYFASTYGSAIGDDEIGSWIFTGVPLEAERYTVINPTPKTKGYKYFFTALYTGTLQEFDTDDDGRIDVWAVTLRENPKRRKGQLEYIWRDGRIKRIRIEYQSMSIEAPIKSLEDKDIKLKDFKSPWEDNNRKK